MRVPFWLLLHSPVIKLASAPHATIFTSTKIFAFLLSSFKRLEVYLCVLIICDPNVPIRLAPLDPIHLQAVIKVGLEDRGCRLACCNFKCISGSEKKDSDCAVRVSV
ncbi:hypothetical protein V2J09_004606 [Rumex salicifolius]